MTPPRSRLVLVGTLAGLALLGVVGARASWADVLAALAGAQWPLLVSSLYRIVPLSLNAAAWWVVIPPGHRPGWVSALRLRWIGESVNALLPVAQIGGDFARARLLTAGGVAASDATAAMVADVSIAAITQVLFTLMGAAALILDARSSAMARVHLGWLALLLAIGVATAAVLLAVARLGVGRLIAALPFHLHGRLAARLVAGSADIDRGLRRVRRRRGTLLAASEWHLAGWLAQVVETWLVLRLLGAPVSWAAALAIESLAASARGAAFAVPGGIGVQEGALVALGAAFGVPAPTALALGIIKRGRELLVGAPAIVAWAIAERHTISRLWRRRTMKERRQIERTVSSPSIAGAATAAAVHRLRVGVLVDLHRSPTAGGHVKTWERLAAAAALASADGARIDLTVHFLGDENATHPLGPHVRYRIHRPLFSSASLPFLSHIPDHTDLAPHNPLITSRLRGYDVIHTTDGTFAAARTAARVSRWHGIPLTNSVHTTTPYYTRVFTTATVERIAGLGRLSRLLLERCGVAGAAEARMQRMLDEHHRRCAFVLASRTDDRTRLTALLGSARVGLLRRGIDHALFDPARRDRPWLAETLRIPPERQVVISVGRLDRIKNVLVLAQAVRRLIDQGRDLQLCCAGKGPDRDALQALLGDRVSCPGVLEPSTLARLYASSDLCAQPAVIEELSNAVLEAASSGLPLVVAAGSGSERFVIERTTGMVARAGTPEAWAETLHELLRDPGRLAEMGREARAWSLAHTPTWHQVLVEDLLPAWRGAAEQSPTGGGLTHDRLRHRGDGLRRRPRRTRAARAPAVGCAAWSGRPATPPTWRGCPSTSSPAISPTPRRSAEAMAGCDQVFHCAADYRLYARDPAAIYRTNVDGTRNVLAAAEALGVRRVVYTSSVATLAARTDGTPVDERAVAALDDVIGDYKRSKVLAEREVERAAARGLPVVIVSPSTPVGEGDVKPTPTGKIIVDFLTGRLPAYVDTGLNLIDVRDVAAGHLLAAEKGRPGERYILANANLTLKALLELLAGIAGRPAPRLRLPRWLPLAIAHVEAPFARLFDKEPRVPLDGVRMAHKKMFFDGGKAVRELGLPQSPIESALERAVEWFGVHGYITGRADARGAVATV